MIKCSKDPGDADSHSRSQILKETTENDLSIKENPKDSLFYEIVGSIVLSTVLNQIMLIENLSYHVSLDLDKIIL